MFDRIFAKLVDWGSMMRSRPRAKAHLTAANFYQGDFPQRIERTIGGLNSKIHAVCYRLGRRVILVFAEGQIGYHKGAALLFPKLLSEKVLLGDQGYDGEWFRAVLADQSSNSCTLPKAQRYDHYHCDKQLCRQRNKIGTCSVASRTGGAS